MISDVRFDAGRFRATLGDAVSVLLVKRVLCEEAHFPGCCTKQVAV
jgi:hypothetical protein